MLIDKYLINEHKDEFKFHYTELKSAEKATQYLFDNNKESIDDYDDGPLFWIGLAEAQWDYGVLEEEIKVKAIASIEELKNRLDLDYEKGKSSTVAYLNKKLVKLNSPQPAVKKLVNKKYYVCPWEIGDVFAYKFTNLNTQEKGYIYFVKVDNEIWYPKHVIPVMYVFKHVSKELLPIEDIKDFPIMPQGYYPLAYERYPNDPYLYKLKLVITKEKESKLFMYLGNMETLPDPERASKHFDSISVKFLDRHYTDFFEAWDIKIE